MKLPKIDFKQKSTWTGGGSLAMLVPFFGVEEPMFKVIAGVAIALINAYDFFRNEAK